MSGHQGGEFMTVKVVDMVELAREREREVVFNKAKLSTWVHVYPEIGQKMDMHCHNHDETFYVIEGECTMHFPDGGKAVMKPGMVALIPGGSFYQLENSGDRPMVLMGNRGGSQETSTYVNYDTRKAYKSRYDFEDANPDSRQSVRPKE
jgi:mannose-6-phosphate isomerase-like protein (cupin superfamily)